MRQMVVCDITREHPAEIYSKPGRGLHVTGEAGLDSVKRLYLVTGIIIQSGTTEYSAFVIQLEIG